MTVFTLGLDLDGVCGDYLSEFRRHAARALKVPETDLADPVDYSFVTSGWGFRDHDHYLQVHADAVRDGLFRSLTPLPGAVESLWRLSDAGVHIRVVTHRLIVKNEHGLAAADTVAWLDRHRIPYRDLCFTGMKTHVDADVYLDDAPVNILALRAEGKDAIVFETSYNQDIPGPRARNWAEAEQLILERFHARHAQAA